MTDLQAEKQIDGLKKLLDDNFVYSSVESFPDPMGYFNHWVLFVYSDEDHRDTLGKVETLIHPQTGVLELFWCIKWYSLLNPVQGVYEPLYEYDCGYSDSLGVFIEIVKNKLYKLESQKRVDIRKKKIAEE